MMSVGQMCSQEAEAATNSDVEVPRTVKTSSKRARSRKRHSPASDERESSVQEDDDDDDDDDESAKSDNGGGGGGGNDHNRWYCNICKDGGELLCCDRCPRAFHTACLSMDPDDIPRPDSSWYCKLCSDTLDRRNAKRAVKDQKRHQREEEKRLRDLAREAKLRERDEALARRSAKALEDKTKRVLDMKERIVKKQKVTYKDREEEKLGKIAENSAETIRQAKEKLEKLEKEDAILKKKEQALAKSRRQHEHDEITNVGPVPEATPCTFGGIPSTLFRQVLSAWDFVVSFQKVIGISPMSVDQLCDAIMSPKFSPLVNELHMCLLDLILESREGDTTVSEEDADMDPLDRYRFEVVHAPLTVGVPTSNMLNFLSWPAVLANLITAVPRYFNNASPAIKAAVTALAETEYPQLSITHKLALLDFLITLAYSTEKLGRLINFHVQERTEASKEHSRLLFQEKRDKAEENKRALEQQKADKAKLASEQKVAMQNWLKGGKKGAAPVVDDESVANSSMHTDDASSTQSENDDDESENSSDEDEEELKSLQAKGIISRQEYLVRKKKLEVERDARRKEKEERARKSKQKEQLLKKRALLVEELNLAMEMRDLDRLQLSLKAAKENGMHTLKKPKVATGVYVAATPVDVKLYEDAVEFAERLEADVAKEQEMEERKQSFEKAMREYFIRTQPLGKDGSAAKYWLFRGDSKRMYVEHADGKWLYYDSPTTVQGLVDALHESSPLKKELLPHVDSIVKEMKKPATDAEWHNKAKTWSRSYHDLTLDEVKKELLHVQETVTTRLVHTRGTMWIHIQQAEWKDNVEAATTISGLAYAVLALEREVSGQEEVLVKVEDDDDDEEEDETFAQNSLWPSKKSRERWIAVVTQCQTLASIALSLASLVQRMDIWSVTGGSAAVKKEAKVKREAKRVEYDDDADGSEASPAKPKRQPTAQPVEREWEEYCCICKDGGDLLCCDGCPKVFHFTCVGLRRIPRGKTFCPSCDRSVKPVYPVVMPPGSEKDDSVSSQPQIKSEEEWDAFCNLCKNGGELLLCDGCPRAFHVDCLNLENFDENEDWFCVDCENQSCGQCKKGRIRMDSHVICGNEAGTKGCERVFHLKCAKLDQVPANDWYCKRCLKVTK